MSNTDPVTIVEQWWNDVTTADTPASVAAGEAAWNNFFAEAQQTGGNPPGLYETDPAKIAELQDDINKANQPNTALQWGLIAGGSVLALLLLYEVTHKGR